MKVRELIERLAAFDPDAIIEVEWDGGFMADDPDTIEARGDGRVVIEVY
jgi:hypothetical protein